MMEDCATSMSAPHGCNDDTAVVESFKEALIGRVGVDRYRMWFSHGVDRHDRRTPTDKRCRRERIADKRRRMPNHVGASSPRTVRTRPTAQELSARDSRRGDAGWWIVDGRPTLSEEPPAEQTELPLDDSECGDEPVRLDEPVRSKPVPLRATAAADAMQCERVPTITVDRRTATARRRHRLSERCFVASQASENSIIVSSDCGRCRAGTETNTTRIQIVFRRALRRRPNCLCPSWCRMPSAALTTLPTLTLPIRPGKLPAKSRDRSQPWASAVKDPAIAASASPARPMSAANFVQGSCNQLAYTAMVMVCQNPASRQPAVSLRSDRYRQDSHLMSAIADQFRRRHRMRRVMHLSAEQFTNDFISSVGNSGITAFRRRYREVDALLIDDVQFLGSKKATLREMLYTVETLAARGAAARLFRPAFADRDPRALERAGRSNGRRSRLSRPAARYGDARGDSSDAGFEERCPFCGSR